MYQAIRAGFATFTKLPPALAGLRGRTMIRDALSASLRGGAIRYRRVRGPM